MCIQSQHPGVLRSENKHNQCFEIMSYSLLCRTTSYYYYYVRPVGATPQDFHRPPGAQRYAQPPPGTYANLSGRSLPTVPPSGSQLGMPPTAVVAPSPAGAPPVPTSSFTPGMFSGMSMQTVTPPGVVPLNYTPVTHHWFYAQFIELRQCWKPFSMADSGRLEDAFRAGKNMNLFAKGINSYIRRLPQSSS